MTTKWTEGPWEYVASTEHHGPYVSCKWGGDICDCYVMSNPMAASVRNGGESYHINHQGDKADANAHLIAAAPCLAEAVAEMLEHEPSREDFQSSRKGDLQFKIATQVWDRARAALSRAKGETQ